MQDLSRAEIAYIKGCLRRGDRIADIASQFRIEAQDIADIRAGRAHADVPALNLTRPARRAEMRRDDEQRQDSPRAA